MDLQEHQSSKTPGPVPPFKTYTTGRLLVCGQLKSKYLLSNDNLLDTGTGYESMMAVSKPLQSQLLLTLLAVHSSIFHTSYENKESYFDLTHTKSKNEACIAWQEQFFFFGGTVFVR